MRLIPLAACGLAGALLLTAQFRLNRDPATQPPPTNSAAPKPPAAAPAAPAKAASVPAVAGNSAVVQVTSDKEWLDTGVEFKAGDSVTIAADGELKFAAANAKSSASLVTPKGVARGFRDLMRVYPVNEAPRGALIGRFGDSTAARAFLIGLEWQGRAPIDGRLFLGVNQSATAASEGHFKATVTRGTAAPEATASIELPDFPQVLLDSIPRRVQDAAGTPGDRTNFVLVATRERVREAYERAGWALVDKDKSSAVLSGLLATLSRRSYVTLPMSELMLFGRTQDFGFAQGDPIKVVAERHHFRLWQAPFDLVGYTVWAGAGTHDIGFDKDQRTGGLTHKIDPQVDGEREYIVDSLRNTGLVVRVDYLTPADPIRQAKTAHGEEFFSDGRTAIIYLRP
jgi:hypothetical protein